MTKNDQSRTHLFHRPRTTRALEPRPPPLSRPTPQRRKRTAAQPARPPSQFLPLVGPLSTQALTPYVQRRSATQRPSGSGPAQAGGCTGTSATMAAAPQKSMARHGGKMVMRPVPRTSWLLKQDSGLPRCKMASRLRWMMGWML